MRNSIFITERFINLTYRPGEPPSYDARYMLRCVRNVVSPLGYFLTFKGRPETIESLFLAYRLTGDQLYRDHGWNIFQSIEKYCRVDSGGYATIINVDAVPVRQEDKMETFFLVRSIFLIKSFRIDLCAFRARH